MLSPFVVYLGAGKLRMGRSIMFVQRKQYKGSILRIRPSTHHILIRRLVKCFFLFCFSVFLLFPILLYFVLLLLHSSTVFVSFC
jgi:hypothetical protein